MFNQVLKALFYLIHPFINLVIHLWISFMLIPVLLIKDCLDIFLWACLKLKYYVVCILLTLCSNNSLVWDAFLNQVHENFSEPTLLKWSYKGKQSAGEFTSSIRTPRCQVKGKESPSERENCEQYMCRNCRSISEVLLRRKNLIKTSHASSSPIREVFKYSVGTQTIIEKEFVNTESSHFQTPTHSSVISIFGKGELDSAESLNNFLKSSNIKERVAVNCKLSPVRYPSSSCEFKNDVSSRSLNAELEKIESSSLKQKDSRRMTPENIPGEFVDIPLESPENMSQLLESPLCQINLESMRNLRLQFSQDICIPKLSPEEKSIFRKSWNKLKLIRKANKRFLEMRNIKRENPRVSKPCQESCAEVRCTDISHENKLKNLTEDEEEEENIGCCSYMFHTLKSKFDQKDDEGSVVYKKF